MEPARCGATEQVFADYEQLQRSGHVFTNGDLNSMLRVLTTDPKATLRGLAEAASSAPLTPHGTTEKRQPAAIFEAIEQHDMSSGSDRPAPQDYLALPWHLALLPSG